VILFLGISIGFGLGSLLNSNFLGFLIVSLLFALFLLFFNKKIIKNIINKQIEKSTNRLFEKKEDGNK
jgi:uncharacterized membrane protein